MKLPLKRTYVLLAYFFSIFVLSYTHFANDAVDKNTTIQRVLVYLFSCSHSVIIGRDNRYK